MFCLFRVDVEVVERGVVSKGEAEVSGQMPRFIVTMADEAVTFKASVRPSVGPRVMASSSTSGEELDARRVLLARREQIRPSRAQMGLGDSLGDGEDKGANGLRDAFVNLEEVDSEEQSEGKKPDRSNIPR